MNLHVAQSQRYVGDDWWEWSVWIEGPPPALDSIENVTYRLHPTFPNPLRTVKSRATKFRLDTAGWGTFCIFVKVQHRDGTVTALKHELTLNYPDDRPAPR